MFLGRMWKDDKETLQQYGAGYGFARGQQQETERGDSSIASGGRGAAGQKGV